MTRRIELLEVKIAATEAATNARNIREINLLRSYKAFYTPKKLDL